MLAVPHRQILQLCNKEKGVVVASGTSALLQICLNPFWRCCTLDFATGMSFCSHRSPKHANAYLHIALQPVVRSMIQRVSILLHLSKVLWVLFFKCFMVMLHVRTLFESIHFQQCRTLGILAFCQFPSIHSSKSSRRAPIFSGKLMTQKLKAVARPKMNTFQPKRLFCVNTTAQVTGICIWIAATWCRTSYSAVST